MPKNKGLGGKKRRKGKIISTQKREIVHKEPGQEYAQVVKSLGNGFMEVICFTNSGNITKRAHIRGNMRKRVWLSVGDIILVNVRDYQESTCDIVIKYTLDEARILRYQNLIPASVEIIKASDDNDIIEEIQLNKSESDELSDYCNSSNDDSDSDYLFY